MGTFSQHSRAVSQAQRQLIVLVALAWLEAARIGQNLVFDITLNTWHYSLSLSHGAEAIATRALQEQRARITAYARLAGR